MIEKIKYTYRQNKVVFIIGSVIFGIAFITMLFITINAFLGGAIFNRNSEPVYSLGENAYGKITYTGDISNNRLNGDGTIEITGNKFKASLIGSFIDNQFVKGVVDIRDYANRKNTMLIGNFSGNDVTSGRLRFEDKEGNAGIYEGDFVNGEIESIGSVYYLLESTDTAVEMTGNFKEGKLITPEKFNEAPLSSANEE